MEGQDPQGGRIPSTTALLSPRRAHLLGGLHRHETAITGLTKSSSLDGGAYSIAVGQIDIANAASDMT